MKKVNKERSNVKKPHSRKAAPAPEVCEVCEDCAVARAIAKMENATARRERVHGQQNSLHSALVNLVPVLEHLSGGRESAAEHKQWLTIAAMSQIREAILESRHIENEIQG